MTSVRDIIVVAIFLFIVGVGIFFIVDLNHKINAQLIISPTINTTKNIQIFNNVNSATNLVDYMYLAAFVGFFLSIIITGWIVGGLPIASPIYFFIVVLFTFVAVILQLAWADLSVSTVISSNIVNLPITNFILGHLGYMMAIFGLTGILVMFAKPAQVTL